MRHAAHPNPFRRNRDVRLRPILTGVAGLLLVITATAGGAGARTASGLCAYHDSTTRDGLVATATIHVVQDNCQVSFVSIMKFWDGNAIYKTATGTFAASDTRVKLSVLLPCDQGSETDVVLGPPTLYPLGDLDLGATAFDVACPAGGGGGGGGGTTSYPDLAATVTAARKSPVRIGDTVPLTVTVKNNGA